MHLPLMEGNTQTHRTEPWWNGQHASLCPHSRGVVAGGEEVVAMEVVRWGLLWRWLGGGCYGGGRAVVAMEVAGPWLLGQLHAPLIVPYLTSPTYVTPVVVSAAGHVRMGSRGWWVTAVSCEWSGSVCSPTLHILVSVAHVCWVCPKHVRLHQCALLLPLRGQHRCCVWPQVCTYQHMPAAVRPVPDGITAM